MKIILASKSPRRKEILENLKIKFDIMTEETDESSDITDPAELVRELSVRKGAAVVDKIADMCETAEDNGKFLCDDVLVLSSDTVVAVDGIILGKPSNLDHAREMLGRLEGREHSVYSGIAATLIKNGTVVKTASAVEETSVRFAKMTDKDIEFYVNNESVLDKAGAYAIQGIASAWIEGIDGDYFNVVGLPVRRLISMLADEFDLTLEVLRSDACTSHK